MAVNKNTTCQKWLNHGGSSQRQYYYQASTNFLKLHVKAIIHYMSLKPKLQIDRLHRLSERLFPRNWSLSHLTIRTGTVSDTLLGLGLIDFTAPTLSSVSDMIQTFN